MTASHPQYMWCNGSLRAWNDGTVHAMNYSMQYGVSAFEGIRLYDTEKGPAIFRLKEHIDRLFYSMAALGMVWRHISHHQIKTALIDLAKANEMSEGYFRPIAYLEEGVGLPATDFMPHLDIALLPPLQNKKTSYHVCFSTYRRINPQTTNVEAKISGNYVNSHLAFLEAREQGYDDAILCDHEGYVAEACAANIFWVHDNVCYTTPRGAILNGITRKTIMEIIRVIEEEIKPQKLLQADEIFLCGTAYEIKPVVEIGCTLIGNGTPGPMTRRIAQLYQDIVRGRVDRCHHWLTYVE